jgi:threonine aldolase
MSGVNRREFVGMAAAASGLAAVKPVPKTAPGKLAVDFSVDGIPISTREYADLLAKLAGGNAITADQYSLGGAVETVEKQFAAQLRKEVAVFMPSGTLANHLAVRALCGTKRRAIVQEISHLYNDSGDGAQQLSQLNLIPLAAGKAMFSWDDIAKVLERTASGRVAAQVGAISIESPVRRLHGETFDFGEMQRISGEARKRGIGLHLDGARLFIASAYSGRAPAEYAALFDTVYVSLWKSFNAASGAIIAGPRALLVDMFHVRRMFGGNLWGAWPFAAVASHYADGYVERLTEAVRVSEDAWKLLARDERFTIERVNNGTNVLRVVPRVADLAAYRERLAARGVSLPPPEGGGFWLKVNETARGASAESIAEAFRSALS